MKDRDQFPLHQFRKTEWGRENKEPRLPVHGQDGFYFSSPLNSPFQCTSTLRHLGRVMEEGGGPFPWELCSTVRC